MTEATSGTTTLSWDAAERLVRVRYTSGITLKGEDGDFLASTVGGWIGPDKRAFGVLADAQGLQGTDAAYRSRASAFFKQHRDTAAIALVNLGPIVGVLVEMFRIGTGVRLKAFGDEALARAWLREKAAE